MSCCGGKRTELQTMLLGRTGHERGALVRSPSQTLQTSVVGTPAARFAAARTPMVAPSPPQAARFGTVALRYLAGAPILVRGPATRTEYRFTRDAPLQRVAQADAAALIASGYFRRES